MQSPKETRDELAILLDHYASAIVEDNQKSLGHTREILEAMHLKEAGYVGAPIFIKNNQVVAQVTFNYNKNNTISKRNPYTVTISEK